MVAYLAFVWWTKAEGCSEQCALSGSLGGELRFNDGGRFELGMHCECTVAAVHTVHSQPFVLEPPR